jgi:single-strand DNA-binding protein
MNKAILMGRLTADPELRQTPNGVSVARFSIAVDRRFSGRDGNRQTDFINCVAWRQTADFLCRYFHKGNMVALIGSIQSRSWDGNDGKKHYATEVVADEVYFTGEKASASGQNSNYAGGNFASSYSQQAPNTPAPQTPAPSEGAQPNFDEFDAMGFSALDGSEDDLPF